MASAGDVQIKWHGAQATEHLKAILRPRLKRAGSETRNHVVRKITEGKTRVHGPSEPGTPPHINEGNLRKSIFWAMDPSGKLLVRVGTTVDYGLYLEEGTRNMAARPYLRPSLSEMQPKIRSILKGKYKKG